MNLYRANLVFKPRFEESVCIADLNVGMCETVSLSVEG